MVLRPSSTMAAVLAAAASVGSAQAPCSHVLQDISLERCVQRCRDAMASCNSVAYDASASTCAIGVQDASQCTGGSWSIHSTPTADCSYGYGRASTAVPCGVCPPGSASHAFAGDLTGIWLLMDSSNQDAGRLDIDSVGFATFTRAMYSGTTERFRLWHARSDPNYPGAFYAETASGWDYAWTEDAGSALGALGGPRLQIRRFCSAGPYSCANAASPAGLSPEGSILFETSFTGRRTSGYEAPCSFLEGSAFVPAYASGTATPGSCCAAVENIENGQNAANAESAQITIDGTLLTTLPMVGAIWNPLSYVSSLRNLQLKAFQNGTESTLCGEVDSAWRISAGSNFVMFAMRGGCGFNVKADNAAAAGASALFIGNNGNEMPGYLELPSGFSGVAPTLPTWLIDQSSATSLEDALLPSVGSLKVVEMLAIGLPTVASTANLQEMCCSSSCKARAELAQTVGLGQDLDVARVCALVDCNGYTAATPSFFSLIPGGGQYGSPCGFCPAGSVAETKGLASCATCGVGQMPSFNGASCISCPSGKISLGRECTQCPSGSVPDATKGVCVTDTRAPPTPIPTSRATSGVTYRQDFSGIGGSSASGGEGVYVQESDFPWGTLIAIFFVLCSCGCICGLGFRWYQTADIDGMMSKFREGGEGESVGKKGDDHDEEKGKANDDTKDKNKSDKAADKDTSSKDTPGKKDKDLGEAAAPTKAAGPPKHTPGTSDMPMRPEPKSYKVGPVRFNYA